MTEYERIANSVPVNKTAAVVAGGTTDDAPLTPKQQRENLLPALSRLEAAIKTAGSRAERKRLGQKKIKVQQQITAIMAGQPKRLRPTYTSNFVEAARAMLTPAMFRMIGNEAFRRTEADEADTPEPQSSLEQGNNRGETT